MQNPDRKPRGWQTNHPSQPNDPRDLGRDPTYHTAGLSYLLSQLRTKYDRGFTKTVLHMLPGNPMTPTPQSLYTSAFWHIIDEKDRTTLRNLPRWLTNLSIFAGHKILSPFTHSMTSSRNPDLTLTPDSQFWHDNWAPLFNALQSQGTTFDTLFLDSASGSPTEATTLSTQERRFRIAGEALPILDAGAGGGPGGRVYNLDATHISSIPWSCDLSFYRSFSTGAPIPWSVDPSTTECRVGVQPTNTNSSVANPGDPAVTLAEVEALVDAGFIVDSWGGVSQTIDGYIVDTQTPKIPNAQLQQVGVVTPYALPTPYDTTPTMQTLYSFPQLEITDTDITVYNNAAWFATLGTILAPSASLLTAGGLWMIDEERFDSILGKYDPTLLNFHTTLTNTLKSLYPAAQFGKWTHPYPPFPGPTYTTAELTAYRTGESKTLAAAHDFGMITTSAILSYTATQARTYIREALALCRELHPGKPCYILFSALDSTGTILSAANLKTWLAYLTEAAPDAIVAWSHGNAGTLATHAALFGSAWAPTHPA